MAQGDITTKRDAVTAFTITVASLADSAARQSDLETNTNDRPAFLLGSLITTGTGPTAGAIVEIYLLRGNGSGITTDGAGASDAAITIENATLLGTLVCDGTDNQGIEEIFDSAPLGPLDEEFGIAVANATGVALNATGGNHSLEFETYFPNVEP